MQPTLDGTPSADRIRSSGRSQSKIWPRRLHRVCAISRARRVTAWSSTRSLRVGGVAIVACTYAFGLSYLIYPLIIFDLSVDHRVRDDRPVRGHWALRHQPVARSGRASQLADRHRNNRLPSRRGTRLDGVRDVVYLHGLDICGADPGGPVLRTAVVFLAGRIPQQW